VPYVVILLQAAEAWKQSNGGNLPKTFAEKNTFKEGLKNMAKDYSKQLNFQEAFSNAFKLFQDREVP